MPCNLCTPFLNRQEGGKDIDYSTFPGSIWPEKGEDFSSPDSKADIIDCFYLAEKILQVVYFYDIVFQSRYPISPLR
ncbi:hypothetical protein MSMAS_1462 [Methanosarcina mazei S-6]|uniref:Uncharacterized protein n=1 Tax=Methanosarcina mazei S-6 TaxID=213585 RepID=A0A0E3RFT0_METMZ|nr:hypothetical protein MSMAS_1462 [Methanosarcina mazei S-6]